MDEIKPLATEANLTNEANILSNLQVSIKRGKKSSLLKMEETNFEKYKLKDGELCFDKTNNLLIIGNGKDKIEDLPKIGMGITINSGIVGRVVEGEISYIDGSYVLGKSGAEIFNNYDYNETQVEDIKNRKNLVIGENSSAFGVNNRVFSNYSYVFGNNLITGNIEIMNHNVYQYSLNSTTISNYKEIFTVPDSQEETKGLLKIPVNLIYLIENTSKIIPSFLACKKIDFSLGETSGLAALHGDILNAYIEEEYNEDETKIQKYYCFEIQITSSDTGNTNFPIMGNNQTEFNYELEFLDVSVPSGQNSFIIGKYNNRNNNNIFEIGNGESESSRNNLFSIGKDEEENLILTLMEEMNIKYNKGTQAIEFISL